MLASRRQYPRMGNDTLHYLLKARGVVHSATLIGRIPRSLRRRLPREPWAVQVRRERLAHPSATRVPKDQRHPTVPGALIHLATMHLRPLPGIERRLFTAIELVVRWAVVGVRATTSAGTATAFLADLIARMPVPVRASQVAGGSAVMAECERACQARTIASFVLPPRSPKLKGRVERLNGAVRRAFWACEDGEVEPPIVRQALRFWRIQDTTI